MAVVIVESRCNEHYILHVMISSSTRQGYVTLSFLEQTLDILIDFLRASLCVK